jgi:hypothetical protein
MSLPSTSARLSPSIRIRTIQYDANGKEMPGLVLGAVRKLTKNETRSTTKLRSLGTYAFRPAVIVPGPIDNSISLQRVVLYKGDALEAIFGSSLESIYYQMRPFLIEIRKYSPFGRTDTIKCYDCWITKNPISFNIDTEDLLVAQEIDIEVGRIEPEGGLQQVIPGFIAQRLVPEVGGIKL